MSFRRYTRLSTIAALVAAPLSFQPAFGADQPAGRPNGKGAADPMLEFMVIQQDTLIGLGRSVLVSPNAWHEVSRINRLRDPNFILPGQVLRIPARLLRTTPAPAKLLLVTGPVEVKGQPAQTGMLISEGDAVRTSESGSAVIELADRSRVQVPPSSLAELAASRRIGARDNSARTADSPAAPSAVSYTSGAAASGANAPAADDAGGWFTGSLRLLKGSVEIFATKVLRVKPLEVTTPTAVIGVRGTHYRVSYDEATQRSTHSEVVEGKVRFDRADRRSGTDLAAGFGAQVDDGANTAGAPGAVKLPEAPSLESVPRRFERPLVRLTLPPSAGPSRVQVASDNEFNATVSDQRVEAGSEVRIAGLDDGNWFLRVRRIGERGIEGYDSVQPFILKARPEPPAYSAPRSQSKQPVGSVAFSWAQNAQAPNARLQVSQDEQFASTVVDQDNVTDGRGRAELSAAGTYFWRLASIRPDGDHGPFGDPQRFELRPLPTPPEGGISSDGTPFFKWSSRPGDKQQVELARDAKFTEIVMREEFEGGEWRPATPGGGRYYFRYRSVEPDGYVGPFSEPLMIDVPRDKSLLLLLLPILLVL